MSEQTTLEQSVSDLEKEIAELKGKASVRPIDPELNEKISNFLDSYLKCMNKAAEQYLAGNQLASSELYCLGDAIRVMHHIIKIATLI